MRKITLLILVLISLTSFGQTTVTRDTIRVEDSAVVVTKTKTVNTKTGSVSYTYKDTTFSTSTTKIFLGQNPTPNKPPTANAGPDQSVLLPINSVNLSGSGTDLDGTIVGYLWEKVSGGTAIIASPTTSTTSVNNLQVGAYNFRLTVTDNDGATATDNVIITVTSSPIDTSGIKLSIEGFGIDATGGGNSSVIYHVTNLNASGSGSLTAGIGSNKTIVFDVSGTINVRLYVTNQSFLTIDAYSSKQDITIQNTNGDVLTVENSHHIIIRGLRFTGSAVDGLNATGTSHDVAFDHCASENNGDGSIDLAAVESSGKNFTVQWCIMGNNHGSGNMLITTQSASVHHNLFLGDGGGEGAERNPFVHSRYSPVGTPPNADFRNNLITASGRYATGDGYGAKMNVINNYYTSSKAGLINFCADPASCGSGYAAGNFNQPKATGGTIVTTEYPIPDKYKINMTDATAAAKLILQNVGTYKRNKYEQDAINAITIQ